MTPSPIIPRWLASASDLPSERAPQRYAYTAPDGQRIEATFAKRERQALEALRSGPIYCASFVRLSDLAFRIRNVLGDEVIETLSTHEGRRFYRLAVRVSPVSEGCI